MFGARILRQEGNGAMSLKAIIRRFVAFPIFYAVDAGVNLIDRRPELPPFPLRAKVGSIKNVGGRKWLKTGQQMFQEVVDFCGLTPQSNVVEIGCSCGITAIPMKAYLMEGQYTGLDIIPELIDWCEANLADERFRFFNLGVYHELYNQNATASSKDVRFPVADDTADVVFLVSVFTHLLPEEVAHYLAEISRILKPGGQCMATMLTMDSYVPEQSRLSLKYVYSPDCLCYDEQTPTKAVAYSQSFIHAMAEKAGMSIVKMAPGSWNGQSRAKFLHDMYVFKKEQLS
jgi:SAM-dependent methyltransferase